MRSKRTRKQPVSSRPIVTVSSKLTQSTISRFHTLLKRQARLKKQLGTDNTSSKLAGELEAVQHEIAELGGLDAYQKASQLGQSTERGGDSSKVLIAWLREDRAAMKGKGKEVAKLRMLEIGAVAPSNYASCSSWIENHPIDLHSQHPDIVEQDFLMRSIPQNDTERYDIVSCSLVLNFVSDPADRGKMIQLIHQHLLPFGLLFLVLPLPCVNNSRYLSMDVLGGLMKAVGFELVKERWKPGSKVGYWLWRRTDPPGGELEQWRRKILLGDGVKKNNFSILLPVDVSSK